MGVKAEASIITALDDVVGSVPNTHAAAFCCTLPITWAWASIIALGQRDIVTGLPTTMLVMSRLAIQAMAFTNVVGL